MPQNGFKFQSIPHWFLCLIYHSRPASKLNCSSISCIVFYPIACPEGRYRCPDGDCIFEIFRCDYLDDCGDFSDELDCVCDLDNEFQCYGGGCVNTTWVCDGEQDCADGSDEASENCELTTIIPTTETPGLLILCGWFVS